MTQYDEFHVEELQWPAQSSDLTEHIWDELWLLQPQMIWEGQELATDLWLDVFVKFAIVYIIKNILDTLRGA